jgi:hypothetical protein
MKKKTQKVSVLLALVTLTGVGMAQDQTDDPVLDFYRERVAGQTESRNPDRAGLTYSLSAHAFKIKLGRGGEHELQDSAAFTNYYSYGDLDSQTVAYSTDAQLEKTDLTYPNIFARDYAFRFYPNDTGGADLAIGFESDTVKNLSPVGLAIIDRNHFTLRRLYMYYPNEEKYERYSRVVAFQDRRGYLFPDTVLVTYAKAGIFSVDNYRVEVVVDSVHLDLPPPPDTVQ